MKTIAVDWSGAVANDGAKAIAIATANEDGLTDIIPGPKDAESKGRKATIEYLLNQADESDGELVVGLDFAFSLPAWYLDENGFKDAPELWKHARSEGEGWWDDGGRSKTSPFWRADKAGKPNINGKSEFRWTEQDPAIKQLAGSSPRSAFQLSGAGSVGSSTVRGLPYLADLKDAGFNIWPWDDAKGPLVIEVWPRIAVGQATKSSPSARVKRVEDEMSKGRISNDLAMHACTNDNAFDAVLTALWLAENTTELLGSKPDPAYAKEGLIWTPPQAKVAL